MYLSDYFTVPISVAGIPAISLPAGLAKADGSASGPSSEAGALPVGLQIAGPAFSENRLLDAAFALEKAFEFAPGPWSWES
jgi:aspartyl-tRNA(Asn)/glutamyl-tRNA(Gln) amidotransferase subunit A